MIENQGVNNYQPKRNNRDMREYQENSPAYAYNNQYNRSDENVISSEDESGFTDDS